ncbi:cytochrome c-type biogenesis protein CcmH [Shimia gijangensis]|uniref:Cytochrome c-type biogenesis protein CcmH n=1 Tax=Shimia gijangensis TaxID=1470563 RepID=A0A1M6E6A7_9RHOB|nr:c-type cytochrome biogenesis protein CcmI [Shimia gijangensis]SHI80945.1 cytochrome c-type biogenesis protein CcmH [Shimia gijangensis]
MVFWIVASLIVLAIAGLLAIALLKGRSDEEPPAAYDLRVYRDQLKEIERDVARGVVAEEDADRVRAEISRRILAADAQAQDGGQSGGQPRSGGVIMAVVMAVVLLGGAMGTYWKLGAPGYRDMPLDVRIQDARKLHDTRPGQAEIESRLPDTAPNTPEGDLANLVTKLRDTVANAPEDLKGHQLLARTEMNLGNDKQAYEAQQGVIRLKGDDVLPEDYLMLAELMISVAQGYVSPEAENALSAAMELQPRHPVARYYWGEMLIQSGRPDLAFRLWEKLYYESAPEAPWMMPIRARIEDLAWMAGEKFRLPEENSATPGPSQADMQAAGDMSAEDRQEMIRGMVSNLSERLATEGGTPAEWARLIGAYGVLEETDRAKAIWAEAQSVFAEAPEALAIVEQGARQAGIIE